MNHSLRFNKLFPGLLLAGALTGTVLLAWSAVSIHLASNHLWTATWVGTTYLLIAALIVTATIRLVLQTNAPDCKPLYVASGVVIATFGTMTLAANLFPRQVAQLPSTVLEVLVPGIGREFDRLEALHGVVVKALPQHSSATEH